MNFQLTHSLTLPNYPKSNRSSFPPTYIARSNLSPVHLFDCEAGDEVDHFGQFAQLVRPHPTLEMRPLLRGQSREPIWVTEVLGDWRDGSQYGEVSVTPWRIHQAVDFRRCPASLPYILHSSVLDSQ